MSRNYAREAEEMLLLYGRGTSVRDICVKFGVSETKYYEIVSRYPDLQLAARKRRQQVKKAAIPMKSKKANVEQPKKVKRRSPQERVKHLEDRLRREKARNAELEELLKVAKEELGKS